MARTHLLTSKRRTKLRFIFRWPVGPIAACKTLRRDPAAAWLFYVCKLYCSDDELKVKQEPREKQHLVCRIKRLSVQFIIDQ